MTRTRRLLVVALVATVLLAGCVGALVDSNGASRESESDRSPTGNTETDGIGADTPDTPNATERDGTTVERSSSTPTSLDPAAIAEAMRDVETVSFDINRSTEQFDRSQNVSVEATVDVESGDARFESVVELPRGTQERTTYVVDDTLYTRLFGTWTRVDLSGETVPGARQGGFADSQLLDAVTLEVLGTRTFEGNELYVVDVEQNLSAVVEFPSDRGFGHDASDSEGDGNHIFGNVSLNLDTSLDAEHDDSSDNVSLGESDDLFDDVNLGESGDGLFDNVSFGGSDGLFGNVSLGESSDGLFDDVSLGESGDGLFDNVSFGESGDGLFDNVSFGESSDELFDDVSLGESDGLFDNVSLGESDGLFDNVSLGESDGLFDNVSLGESDGLFDNVSLGESDGLFDNATGNSVVESETTMYIDTETSRVRRVETTVSVGGEDPFWTTRTVVTVEEYGGPVDVTLPDAASDARGIWGPFR